MTLVALSGCGIQSKIIEARHWELNDTIRTTTDEQLLLNIVRLRYDEVPYFLQMASVTTSFSAGANVGASGTLPKGRLPDVAWQWPKPYEL